MLPRVAIIIACYNGREYLPDCLSSLQAADYPKERCSIAVIDNASTDHSVAYLRERWPDVTVTVLPKNTGFAGANNVGLRQALAQGYEYAFLLNQDTVATPGFLREAVAVAQSDSAIGAVQSKLLRYGTSEINSWGNVIHFLGFGYAGGNHQPDQSLPVREIAYPSGAAVLLRCSALETVGLLDDAFFMYHEDLDLGWRLWISGFRCLLAPASVVYHKYEFSRSIKKYYWMERNRYLVILSLYRWRTFLLIWPAIMLTDFGMLIQSIVGGFWKEEFAAHLAFLKPSTWALVVRRRHQVQQLRRRSDREIVKRFTGKIDFQEIPLSGPVKVANVVLNAYWQCIEKLIRW